jgi:N6-L-threonylcarbamoyladenine synthase
MQKLRERRTTNTPTVITHDRSNCGLLLNSPEGRGSVAGLKTSLNSPDASLTARGHAGQNLRVSVVYPVRRFYANGVYVLNKKGKPLMPCAPRKARVLLKEGKATVVRRTPFTIKLNIATGEVMQPITLGVDSGYNSLGLSAVSRDKELYRAEVKLRKDIVKLNSERKEYRRARRYHKTWYRSPRFLNRKKPEAWLAPSIQHKLDSHIKLINKAKEILPILKISIEVAGFDIQKIKNPNIEGKGYQRGKQAGFWNVREYVFHRDNHRCQHCKGKSKSSILEVHHIISRQTGGDRPENLITLCSVCHDKISRGQLKLKAKPSRGFKAETFMSAVRWKLINKLRKTGNVVTHTYGYITKGRRIKLCIPKSHTNDAFVIAGGTNQKRTISEDVIKQVRKCNRKLFKGNRSHLRNTTERFVCGFQRFDKVLYNGVECFIFGRRKTGYFDLRKLDGTNIHCSAKHTKLTLLESAKTLLIERRLALLPTLVGEDFRARFFYDGQR